MRLSALRLARQRALATFLVAACGIGSHVGAAGADETNQNQPDGVAPVTFGAVTTPAKSQKIAAKSPIAELKPLSPIKFDLSNTARDIALVQIKAGALTMEEAWQSGALTYDNIADLLEHETDVYVIHFQGEDRRLHHQLVELLLQHESARFDALEKVPQRVRLWLADYYQSQGNEKAIAVAQSIVAEHQQPTKGSEPIVFQALERQAWFYQEQRKYELAAETWKRVPSYVTNTDWMIPDAIWQTGRYYLWAGKPDVAEPYFAQAAKQENKFIVTMVTYDKVGALLNAGKNAEASQLAQATLQTVTEPVDRALNLMLLSQSLYANGDFAEAQAAAQSCIEEAAKAKNVNAAIGFDVVSPTAKGLLRWSQLWQKKPLVCSPESLNYKVNTQQTMSKVRVNVRSFKAVPLSVKCDDARVKYAVVPLEDDPWFPRRETRFAEQIIEIEVPLTAALQTELHISSARLPGVTCDIPLQIGS